MCVFLKFKCGFFLGFFYLISNLEYVDILAVIKMNVFDSVFSVISNCIQLLVQDLETACEPALAAMSKVCISTVTCRFLLPSQATSWSS